MAAPDIPVTRQYAQLLALASHELRTPVSVVSGYLRMLQRDSAQPLSDRHRKMVDEAEKACGHMMALLEDLSELAKLDDGRAPLCQDTFDLFTVLQQIAATTTEAADRGVRLTLRGEERGAEVRGDRERLRRAFSAFFRAVLREQLDATQVVALCRLPCDSSALVVVAQEAEIEMAVDGPRAPFDEKRGGLGLALPLARRIVECHGGHVWTPAGHDGAAAARSAILVSLPLAR
jgi:signal transduction histidine kinase